MADLNGQESYEFDEFRLIPGEGLLLRKGEPVPLAPKAFETLLFLVRQRGHLVQKADLMDKVWGDAFVEENALSKCVWSIRNALGEDPKSAKFIQTVPKRGYRFVADVRVSADGGAITDMLSSSSATSSLSSSAPVERPARFRSVLISTVAIALVLGLSAWAFREWLPIPGNRPVVKSLTVVPLENSSGDPAEDYFVEGITDSLTGDLARIEALKVIALPADLRLPSATRDPHEIGQSVGVDGVLTGSVSRSGDRVRISVQLVHAATSRTLWANTYEPDIRGVQSIGAEIAQTIAHEIRITITPKELERLGRPHGVNPEAYDQYLRGRYFLNRQNVKDQDTAIAALERAVDIDPTFTAAYGELSQAYTWKGFSFAPGEKDLAEKAFIATEKAKSSDPDLEGLYYLARGRLSWTTEEHFQHERAIADYKQALALTPSLDEARNQLALVYSHIGLLDDALREAREGVRINPRNNLLQLRIGQTLNSQGKYEEALAVLRGIPDETHPSVIGHQTAWALFNLGRVEEAEAKVEQLKLEHADKGGTFAAMQAVIAALRGQHAEAEEFIRQAIENGKGFGHFHHTAYTIGCAYALMNKKTEAIKWLETAAETGYPCYPNFEVDKNLDNLRRDPMFAAFMKKLRARWEHFKSWA